MITDLVRSVLIATPSPGNLDSILNRLSHQPFAWTYLGQNIADFRRAKRKFHARGHYLDTTLNFHQASGDLRGPFLSYMFRIARELNSLRWWVTSIAYRNCYVSKVFHRSCYLKVGLDLTESQENPEPLVLLSDRAVCRSLESNLIGGKRVLVYSLLPRQRLLMDHVVGTLKMLAHRARFCSRETHRLLLARWIGPVAETPSKPATLLFSWVTKDSLSLGPDFHRSFYGDLAAQLGLLGCPVSLVPMVPSEINYQEALQKIGKGYFPQWLPHRYIRLSDVFRAAMTSCLAPTLPDPIPRLDGMDITPLLQEEQQQDRISNQAAEALLMVALTQRWAQSGSAIKQIIFTYENQPWQRALCWETRRSLPTTRITAYQHARVPRLLLNFHLAPEEERVAPLPDRVVTAGKYSAELLSSEGYSWQRIRVGGALQMNNFFNLPSLPHQQEENPLILVATSNGLEETAELVDLAIRLFNGDAAGRIVLKCHPLTPFEKVSHLISHPLPEHVEVSQDPIINLMMKSAVMVYSGSTVCVQALALGLPVIHLRPQFDLDLDPLEAWPHLRLEAANLAELRLRIEWLLDNREDYITQHREAWDRLVREIYGPVTEQTFRAFLGPEAGEPL